MSAIQAVLRVAERLAPTLKNSKFKETGVLTPEEVRLLGLASPLLSLLALARSAAVRRGR